MDELDAIAGRIVARDSGQLPGPWTLEVYPTLRCNLDCMFCDTTDRHRPPVAELSTERMLRLVDEAAALGVRHVMVLGGGEPLLAASTLPVMRRARAHGMTGMLTTNGTRMHADTQQTLVDIQWNEVHFSLDGADSPTHDGLRGRAGAFQKTTAAMCQLRARRGSAPWPRLAIHTVLTRRNLHQLAALVGLADALGADRLEVDVLVAYAPEHAVLQLTTADVRALPAHIADAQREADRRGISTTLDRLLASATTGRGPVVPQAGDGVGFAAAPCLRAWHHLVVAADGRTSPCCVLAGSGGSVTDHSLAEIWDHDPFLSTVRTGMLVGRATPRCGECSENILHHERAIRDRIATLST